MSESLSDRLAKALLGALDEDSVPDWVVHETAVPAVLAELLPEFEELDALRADVDRLLEHCTGVECDRHGQGHRLSTKSIRALLAASAEMRRHEAWKENGSG